ncbi:MAG: translation initiation factor IF-2 [Aquificae bacterium]|nr:translation initiation factor IF-2 [Aquificota bacterium]
MKVSELAKELNVSSKEIIEAIEQLTGEKIKSASKKISDDIADLIRATLGETSQEPEETIQEPPKEEEGHKLFDVSHQLGIPFDELADKLKAIGFSKEITNFTEIDEETYKKLKQYIEEEKKLEEEKKKELEKQKKEKQKKLEELASRKLKEKTQKRETPRKPAEEPKKEKKIEKKPIPTQEKPQEKPKEEKPKEKIIQKQEPKKEEKVHPKPTTPTPSQKEEKSKETEEKPKFIEKQPIRETKEEKEEREALRKLLGTQPKKKKKKKRKEKEKEKQQVEATVEEDEVKIVIIPEIITVRELAELLNLPVNQIMADLLKRGILATVNDNIDPEIALQIAEEHGFLAEIKKEGEEIEKLEELPEELKKKLEEEEKEGKLVERPPVVVIMGHVDHGKTTLLDTIRKTDIALREKGGITQHIGAYKIKLENGKEITFLDTPGHEAFTTLRARGSKVADTAVLVVAADDGVKPQTVEAINHARSAGLPIIVAINKVDKPGADPDRVKRELTQYELIPEDWGGDTIMVPISAKTGQNLDELLEMILLVSEMLELKANPDRLAIGTIIESKLDPKRGPVATVLVENGTLKIGDYFVAGTTWGKVRAMYDDKGNLVKEAPPGSPVEILGFNEVPQAGDRFVVMKSEREARQLAEQRKQKLEEELQAKRRARLESLKGAKEVNIILKADTQGSLEAIIKAIEELSNKFEDLAINVVHAGLGKITESDVMLAAASNAIIIGFNVRPDSAARRIAEEEGIEIKTYGIIYEIVEDLEKALKGLLEPKIKEVVTGTCEVKQIFRIKGIGTVAGCIVTDGVIKRNSKARLVRDGVVIYDGEINSLKRFKEDVKEVSKGYECGLTLKDFNDIKPGDIIEAYELVEEKNE